MHLCIQCLSVENEGATCSTCGGETFARSSKDGFLTALPAEAGVPCQRCFESGCELRLSYYRWVAALIFVAHIRVTDAYLCRGCRWGEFAKNQLLTLLCGWWGLFALFIYNPYAIAVNFWALFAAPLRPRAKGAISLAELRAQASEEQTLHDLYMRLPSWIDQLSAADLDAILAGTDFYATLHLSPDASPHDIKAAYRAMAKHYHPDASPDPRATGWMTQINEAYRVLADHRLRHAYDHRQDLLHVMRASETETGTSGTGLTAGCRLCETAFETYDAFLQHLDAAHPSAKIGDAYVHFRDGVPAWPKDDDRRGDSSQWQCERCGATFVDYGESLTHLDDAHPEAVAVDPRRLLQRL